MNSAKSFSNPSLAIYFYIFLLVASLGCSDEHVYEGRVIEIDYNNIEDIKNNDWIEIDGFRYTHYEDHQKSYQDEFSLPASRETYYIVKQDSEMVQRYSPVSDFTIAISLGNFVDLTHTNRDTSLARVKINQRYLMHIFGRLIIQRPDSSIFHVRTSKDYPAKIKIIAE